MSSKFRFKESSSAKFFLTVKIEYETLYPLNYDVIGDLRVAFREAIHTSVCNGRTVKNADGDSNRQAPLPTQSNVAVPISIAMYSGYHVEPVVQNEH